jgi:hypothetical protein
VVWLWSIVCATTGHDGATFTGKSTSAVSTLIGSFPVSEILRTPLQQVDGRSCKYSKFQIKGWVNFDPTGKTLGEIAEGIEEGDGFLTLVEVVRVEDDVAKIGDGEARECFENMLAAKRLLQNVDALPKKLVEELRSALNTEGGVAPKKTVIPIASSSAND